MPHSNRAAKGLAADPRTGAQRSLAATPTAARKTSAANPRTGRTRPASNPRTGETNNAINYGTIYCFKALGGSFAGGVAALIMTGTLYGNAQFHWRFGFFFGAAIGALAALTVGFLCKRPTVEQMERATRISLDKEAKAKPAVA